MFMFFLSAIVISRGFGVFSAGSPISLGVWILFMSGLLSVFFGRVGLSWFGFVVFLIYVGGILVIFSYFVAIQPNQYFSLRYPVLIISLTVFILLGFDSPILLDTFKGSDWWVTYVYTQDRAGVIFLLGFVLFLAIVGVVKITTLSAGSLRPFNY